MYPPKEQSVELLVTAARVAAQGCSSDHPEDIAIAMMNAVEASWPVVLKAHELARDAS